MNDYTGTAYVGVVGGDFDYAECRDSIQNIQRRAGDELHFVRATKGYEARQLHLNNFIASKHDFLLLLDHDQTFPPDTLERLRSHKLPYVSGYYMRRRFQPILPVWYEYGTRNEFPFRPWTAEPERGKLHKLGASGWGCILVHREVILAVRAILKGEPEVIEDDMDVWPYDLARITQAVRGLQELHDTRPSPENLYPALAAHITALREEIRPLRAIKDPTIGSDLRFPFFAREAGYTLYGDPDVRCGHMLHYPLSPDDYSRSVNDELRGILAKNIQAEQKSERAKITTAKAGLGGAK